MGKAKSIYLGKLEKVPVRVGTSTMNQEKSKYEKRIFLKCPIVKAVVAKIKEANSKNATQNELF